MSLESENWVRLDPKKLRNVGGDPEPGYIFRVYGLEGKKFPRIVLSVRARGDCFKISCAIKKGPGRWWEDCEIPKQFALDLSEMILEYWKIDL